MNSKPSDKLKSLCNGGESAKKVVEEFAPRLLRFFQYLGNDFRTCEDLTQEVFLKLIRRDWNYQENGAFAAFLFRVAYRIWVDANRKQRPAILSAIDFDLHKSLLSRETEPDVAVVCLEEKQKLQQALWALPFAQRIVFELGVVEGIKYKEIAEILNIPLGTVKSRMFSAVEKLKISLAAAKIERRAL